MNFCSPTEVSGRCIWKEIYYEDFAALSGCRIGIFGYGLNEQVVYDYLASNGITYESIIYSNYAQLNQALESGIVDVICQGNLQACEGIRVVARFGTIEYYCFTSRENERLMKELNNAVKQLKYDDPGFEGSLYEDYFGHSQVSDTPMFTREETEYIANAKPIVVKLMGESVPLSYLNANGEADGIYVDFFRLLDTHITNRQPRLKLGRFCDPSCSSY